MKNKNSTPALKTESAEAPQKSQVELIAACAEPVENTLFDVRERRAIYRAQQILEKAFCDRGALAFRDYAVAFDYFRFRMAHLTREEFHVVWLDNQHRYLSAEALFAGTINKAAVYPREVLRRALLSNAAAAIIAHNHPSGSIEPSPDDIGLTETLKALLNKIDVRLLDHIIVGGSRTFSFAERRLL